MRALRAAAVFVLGTGLALLSACSGKNTLVPRVPPETVLFVQGPVDTVNHVVHLYWFGSDPDGEVVKFELRFLNPAAPADTQWVQTTQTDQLFTVYVPQGYVAPVFEVRAVDNDSLRDPTPAVQKFQLSNLPPRVLLTSPPTTRDTTFASITLTWLVTDPDGDATKTATYVYLDSAGVQPHNLSGARRAVNGTITVPSDDFRVSGVFTTGYRTVYVLPVDDGGRAGAPDSARWFVLAPYSSPGTRAQLLIVDDIPSAQGNNAKWDSLFANTASRNIAAGNYQIIRPQFNPALFRSSQDLDQTFRLFDAVIWYRGEEPSYSTMLQQFQSGIGSYVSNGGKMFLEGMNLVDGIAAPGPLTLDFVRQYLNSDGLYRYQVPPVATDSSVSWTVSNARTLRSSLYNDSLRSNTIEGGLRGFITRDTSEVMLWARSGTLAQPHDYDLPIGLSVRQPGGGRLIISTLALARMDRTFVSGGSQNTARFLAKVYHDLGVIP